MKPADTLGQNDVFLKGVIGSSLHPELPVCNSLKRTSVFLLMKDTDEREILTILKSDTPGYAWRNQIALPGGHVDEVDKTPLDAAFRELSEELNIRSENITVAGSLGHFRPLIIEILKPLPEYGTGRIVFSMTSMKYPIILKFH